MPDPYGWADERDDPVEDEDTGTSAAVALGVGVVTLLLAGAVVAGAAGMLVVAMVLAGLTGLVLALRVPEAPPRRARRRPAPPVENVEFRAYRDVAEQLSWAAVSPRHYDLVTRPLLTSLAAARLAERHGVDLHADPDAAERLVGADAWPWIDPASPPSRDSQPPGVPRRTLALVLDRLERL